ncbi:MAG: SRPBCC domain-containing protein [Bacteroidales bacterium]|nr:SRPBCC domain-containing protein [Bacteroidales bacterium]
MLTKEKTTITVSVAINANVEKVWNLWTNPEHIVKWNFASDDWHTPRAENNLKTGGKFLSRMEARDGTAGFDFTGVYTRIVFMKLIEYSMDDGRKVKISFASKGKETTLTETFEAEQSHATELQRDGWQSILNNFKKYVESFEKTERLHFEITINAGVDEVFRFMLDENIWKEWTAIFNPTSHFIGSWEKGSKILFVGSEKDGSLSGMVGRIRENIPNKYVSIEYNGIVKGGEEITEGHEIAGWAGAREDYTFTVTSEGTLLSVDMDSNQQIKSYLLGTYPKALEKLKEICENN